MTVHFEQMSNSLCEMNSLFNCFKFKNSSIQYSVISYTLYTEYSSVIFFDMFPY